MPSPSLEREAWVTLRRKHLIRHLTVTPSPTGEGNCEALFRQQIYNETVDGRMGYISLLLREKGDRVSGG